jgi:hypothetical protein
MKKCNGKTVSVCKLVRFISELRNGLPKKSASAASNKRRLENTALLLYFGLT